MDQPDHGVQIHVSIALFVMSSDVCVHPWHVRTLLSCHVTHGMCVPCFHCPLQSIVHLTPLVKLSMGSSSEKHCSNAQVACCTGCLFTGCLFTGCPFTVCLLLRLPVAPVACSPVACSPVACHRISVSSRRNVRKTHAQNNRNMLSRCHQHCM